MNHELYLGDCLEVLKEIPDSSVDIIYADPPYGLAKKNGLGWKYSKHITLQETWDIFKKDDLFKFNLDWISESLRTLKSGGSFWVSGSFHNIYQIGFILQQLNVKINNSIVWFKRNAQPNITCRMFTESTEHLIWGVKNDSRERWIFNYEEMKRMNNGKQMRNVWEIPLTPKKEKEFGEHPTQKPIALLERIILSSSKEGDTILDPFLGSGTTSVVAEALKRNSIGIEKNTEYYEIAKKRIDFMKANIP